MTVTQRLAVCFMIGAAALIAMPLASAQEGMRPVGQLIFTPEPIELQTGVISLRPEDRMIRTMRIEAKGGTVDIQSVRLIYRNGEFGPLPHPRAPAPRPDDRNYPQAAADTLARSGSELHSARPGDDDPAGGRRAG